MKATASPTALPASGADQDPGILQLLALTGQCAMARASYVRSARAMAHSLDNWPGFATPPWPTFAPPLTALALKRNDLSASTGKAIALDYLSRHVEAQQVYQEALALWPTNFALMNNYALSLCLSGGAQKGVPILEELIQDPSQGDAARSNLALAYALEGRSRDARAMLEGLGASAEAAATLRYFETIRAAKDKGQAIGQMVFQ